MKRSDTYQYVLGCLLSTGMFACGAYYDDTYTPAHETSSIGQIAMPLCETPRIPYASPGSDKYGCCAPGTGQHGRTSITQYAVGEYQHQDVWCSVGRGLAAGCYFGVNVLSQSLASAVCQSSNTNCTAPNATYDVKCNATVECVYNCDGACIPEPC